MIKLKSLLSTGLGALALGIVTTAAQAGPSGLAGAFDQSSGRSGLAEKVTWYGDGYKGNNSCYGHYIVTTTVVAGTATVTMAIAGTATAISGGGNGARGRPGPARVATSRLPCGPMAATKPRRTWDLAN